jgi:hypothetical protein
MQIIKKHISKIIVVSMLTIFTLQACNIPSNTPAVSDSIEDIEISESVPEKVVEDTIEEKFDEPTVDSSTEEPAEETEPEALAPMEENPTEEETTLGEPEEVTDSILANGLTQAEVDSLVYMREEEKLAHDVYLALYDLWGLPLFSNIASSEQAHTDAVANLLITFNIPDPADTSPAGVFVNETLQGLYDDLVALGAQSLADALKVGGAIEEIDILDLQESLKFVQDPSIQRVYENLLRGSENHLRAFTSTLESQTGEIYEPQYMEEDAYRDVIASGTTRGGRGNGRRQP